MAIKNKYVQISPEEFDRNFADIHPPLTPNAAVIEASRCLFCFDAPCTIACPTHIDVPKFIKKIATRNLRGSARTILEANILGASCSKVCPVEVLCEGACVMNHHNEKPIQIALLQRHAMDWAHDHQFQPFVPGTANGKKVACIGGGPASLACAAELAQLGYAVTIFERKPLAGGLNTYGIAEYKLTPEDALREVESVRKLGVKFECKVEIGGQSSSGKLDSIPNPTLRSVSLQSLERDFDAIFVGIGLGDTTDLEVPGEHLEGVVDALTFIEDYKTKRTKCKVGRRVAVIGAGNTAIDAATAAVRLGVPEVRMVYRRSEAEMPAFAYEYELAKGDGVIFNWRTQPVKIHGKKAVEKLECVSMRLGKPDKTGRRRPEPVPRSKFFIECDMVIKSLGQTKHDDFLKAVPLLKRSRDGRVLVDEKTCQTSNPKFFAGGDCVNGGREVVDAVADGKKAAHGIETWIRRNG
ncbi:MAG: NAD(P)-dependent oxidoreductase [Acidobacteriia bacterium]|nr:NAD(P)-dependent oxidoreductase [Terriglobia bacterium]